MTTEQVQVNLDDLKLALEHDAKTFIAFMIPAELKKAIPDFHPRVFTRMTDTSVDRFVCAIPRDHAKTTLAKLAAVWYFLFSDFRFIVYLSNTKPIAVDACRDIANFLLTDNFVQVFGAIEPIEWQDGVGNYKFKLRGKICMLKAQGAGQQVRGLNKDNQRPELAIVDDLEDMDNTANADLQKKLIRWFYGSFIKALDGFNNKVIHLGNMLSNKSLLKIHCESPKWASIKLGALLSNGQPLWPDKWTIQALAADFQEYTKMGLADLWFAEMMNQPIAAGAGLIRSQDIPLCVPAMDSGDIEYGFMTVDPAISDKDWADECVVAVHGWTGEHWTICEYSNAKGVDPVQMWMIVMQLSNKWGVSVVGIEAVAYQAALKFFFDHLKVEHQREDIVCYDVPARSSKTQRLVGWAGWLKNETYRLNSNHFWLIEQLLTYNPTKKDNDDDVIDACAHGPYMIDNHIWEIMESRSESVQGVLIPLNKISSV